MSSDLLAEFDSFYQAPSKPSSDPTPASLDLSFFEDLSQQNQNGQTGTPWQSHAAQQDRDLWGGMNSFQSTTQPTQENVAQDDLWGSFEAAESAKPAVQSFKPTNVNYEGFPAATQAPPRRQIETWSSFDILSSDANTIDFSPGTLGPKVDIFSPMKSPPLKLDPGDVLFDAEEEVAAEVDDDDFGDFETGSSIDPPAQSDLLSANSQSTPGLDLIFESTAVVPKESKQPLGLLVSPNVVNSPQSQALHSLSFQDRDLYGGIGQSTDKSDNLEAVEGKMPQKQSGMTAWSNVAPPASRHPPAPDISHMDDDWGDFADLPPNIPAKPDSKAATAADIVADTWGWDPTNTATAQPQATAPPSNIPPPSVLLTLFPPLFDLPTSTLFKPIANQAFSLKNRILSDPSTINFLRSYLLLATVSARIITGRKHRWKRDNLLSQAMKIGPSGGKGGMKLAGIDRAEIMREEREAAEVVRAWKEQLGRLRSAVAVVNTSMKNASEHLVIPDVGNMQVKVAEGGLSAPKQCVICGLKREERTVRVDLNVEDSFGEWWVEHWGHTSCKKFWMEHEGKLKHR